RDKERRMSAPVIAFLGTGSMNGSILDGVLAGGGDPSAGGPPAIAGIAARAPGAAPLPAVRPAGSRPSHHIARLLRGNP
ncbi:hypothetical protein ACVB9L_03530, partial [Rothia kristinae]